MQSFGTVLKPVPTCHFVHPKLSMQDISLTSIFTCSLKKATSYYCFTDFNGYTRHYAIILKYFSGHKAEIINSGTLHVDFSSKPILN